MSNELVFSLPERLLVVYSVPFVPLLVPRLDWHDVPRGRRPRKCADHKLLPLHRVVRHVLRKGWRPSGLPKCCETCRFGKAFERKGERDFYFQSLKVRKAEFSGAAVKFRRGGYVFFPAPGAPAEIFPAPKAPAAPEA